ncbi:unnamed protein product [Closterium sp. NIES-54]
MLNSGASRCFFRESTTLTPLPAPVPVRQADPSRGPVLARSSTVLSCPAAVTWPRSPVGLGTLVAPCSCRLLLHRTLLWHHLLGHPSLPRLRGMHSRLLVSGLPWSLPPLPPSAAPPCLPCVEGQQRAAPHSSSFPPTTTPLQTLDMDVWGPAHSVSSSASSSVRTFRSCVCTLTEVVSSPPTSCRGEGILQPFTLPASPQKNGIAERRIGLVMEVARTSMIHAAAPHFSWPIAVRYAAHQLNLWPRVSLPETSPTLRWTWKVDDVSVFRVWDSHAFVRDTSKDQLTSRVFLGFPPDALGWQFYHSTLRRVLPSQDITFDESVPIYHLFPYRTAPLPPPAALPCSRSPSGRPPHPSGSCSGLSPPVPRSTSPF